jgi:hypothetical protein
MIWVNQGSSNANVSGNAISSVPASVRQTMRPSSSTRSSY